MNMTEVSINIFYAVMNLAKALVDSHAVWFDLLFYLQTHKEADTQANNENLVFGNVSFSFLSIK